MAYDAAIKYETGEKQSYSQKVGGPKRCYANDYGATMLLFEQVSGYRIYMWSLPALEPANTQRDVSSWLCNKESGKGEVGGVAIKQQWKEENYKSKVPRKLEIFEEGAIGCVK